MAIRWRSLENYFRQCSILVDCRDLACMAATLANGGVHPLTGSCALPAEHVERVLSVMATCGMYDYAGSWLYEVGMPAKSGVSGGVIAVVPGRFGIGVYSPRLDEKGNSVRGIAACKNLARDFGLHVFARTASPAMALGRVYTGAVAPSRRQPAARSACVPERTRSSDQVPLPSRLPGRRRRRIRDPTHAGDGSGNPQLHSRLHEAIAITDSAARLLTQARLGFADDGIAVVCSRVRDRTAIMGPLRKAAPIGDRGFLVFEDNDLAVEWCENRLVREFAAPAATTRSLADSLLLRGLPETLLRQIEQISRRHAYAQGEQILRYGQEGDGRVFFIESGQVSILVPLDNGAHQRIATLGPGMEFGEMALLGQTTRSASVFADTDVRCRIVEARGLRPDRRCRAGAADHGPREPGERHGEQAAWRQPMDRRPRLMRGTGNGSLHLRTRNNRGTTRPGEVAHESRSGSTSGRHRPTGRR